MHTHADDTFDNCVTLIFDLRVEQLSNTVCRPSLVLIAQVIFLLENELRDRPTDTESQMHLINQTMSLLQPARVNIICIRRSSPMNKQAQKCVKCKNAKCTLVALLQYNNIPN